MPCQSCFASSLICVLYELSVLFCKSIDLCALSALFCKSIDLCALFCKSIDLCVLSVLFCKAIDLCALSVLFLSVLQAHEDGGPLGSCCPIWPPPDCVLSSCSVCRCRWQLCVWSTTLPWMYDGSTSRSVGGAFNQAVNHR